MLRLVFQISGAALASTGTGRYESAITKQTRSFDLQQHPSKSLVNRGFDALGSYRQRKTGKFISL